MCLYPYTPPIHLRLKEASNRIDTDSFISRNTTLMRLVDCSVTFKLDASPPTRTIFGFHVFKINHGQKSISFQA